VTHFIDLSTSRPRIVLGLATLAAAIMITGCGSSSSSSTIGIGNENKANETLAKSEAVASTGTTSAKCPSGAPAPCPYAATTPTSGPLSKEPTVPAPKGPPPSKLVTKEIITGTGTQATTNSTVTVNDVGVRYFNGKEFENTFKRKEPSTFALSQVIAGFRNGIAGMKVGGRRELIIPPAEGYGEQGKPPTIPPNETLVFVVDLLGA